MAFLDYSHLIRNLYRYSKPYPPTLLYHIQTLSFPSTTSLPYTILPSPASHTPDIHGLEQPFRHTRTQPILFLSIQTKPRISETHFNVEASLLDDLGRGLSKYYIFYQLKLKNSYCFILVPKRLGKSGAKTSRLIWCQNV